MDLSHIHRIYFIGIGGIGMSALARYFHRMGVSVSGYDRYPTPLTDQLIREGVEVHYEENVSLLPHQTDLVVYTPAVPPDHAELVHFRSHGFPVLKRSELLREITGNHQTIAVAGSHGKTTTTTMVAHILHHSGYGCTAFLGGISANYGTNLIVGGHPFVVEADEYDRSFLNLDPDAAVVTSCDADHLDIYGTEENVLQAYAAFAARIKPGGRLITRKGLKFLKKVTAGAEKSYYGIDSDGGEQYHASGLQLIEGTYAFDFHFPSGKIEGIHLRIAGKHNVENAVAAMAVASGLRIDPALILESVNTFLGVKRRFEFIIRSERLTYIDDYAHHPAELESLLRSVREIFAERRITLVFQPHLYTRTRDFAAEFARVLSMCDALILLPIYPAREVPIPGVDSGMLLERVRLKRKWLLEKNELTAALSQMDLEVLVTAGAGDIDQWVEPIKQILS